MASQWTMPIIVLSMGGEMVYILHQRLQAQTVNADKATKVLQEVARAMLSPLFIEELFKPQDMYSQNSTRQIFEKLAHSSIMRLNKVSMDKLFDLMSMGFKQQIVSVKCPQQYLQITIVHLEKIRDMVKESSLVDLIDVCIARLISTYASLTEGQWLLLKQNVLRFMQGKRIKVSLFLQHNLQTMNGVLVLNTEGVLPLGTDRPGMICFHEGSKVVRRTEFTSAATQENVHEADSILDFSSTLGVNMYYPDSDSASKSVSEAVFAANQALMQNGSPPDKAKKSASHRLSGQLGSSAKRELTLLADLLGMGAGESKRGDEEKPFKFNLFPGAMDEKESESKSDGAGFIMIDIDGTAGGKTFDEYLHELDLGESKADSKLDEDDDLLALMDSAK